MFRRMLCLLCAVLVLIHAVPACSEAAAGSSSYDFDLAFHLNADSFPELLRTRAAGYAALVNRLGIRGSVAWVPETDSMDLEATLYYTDDPSLSYPFRIYGTEERVFITSPLINNKVIMLNMPALMEFSIKAKNTLGVPLSYFALLFPYTTTSAMSGLFQSWQDVIGVFKESGNISSENLLNLSGLWSEELLNNDFLRWWIMGVADGSEAPSAVEAEMEHLPRLLEKLAESAPVQVSVDSGSQIWKDASGNTLFSSQESDEALSTILSLPASDNGYIPSFSFTRRFTDQTVSFDMIASLLRDPSLSPASLSAEENEGENAYHDSDDDLYEYDEYEDEYESYEYDESGYEDEDSGSGLNRSSGNLPDLLLDLQISGSGLPRMLPADSSFSLSASVLGAVYPNYSFYMNGETKNDGSLTLSLCKPFTDNAEPVEIFGLSGTFLPSANPKEVADYRNPSLKGVYIVFSLNDQTLPAFTSEVLVPLMKNVISFVASAPTSACQSFLDDLTDIGLLDMLLE